MKIYLAARYSRREELCKYREKLSNLGHVVTSRWLNGDHQIDNDGEPIGESGESLVEGHNSSDGASVLRKKFAKEDVEDVIKSDLLIAFTEVPRSTNSRGGRHVEMGLAIGRHISVMIVGPRENVFCWLPYISQHETFDSAVEMVGEIAANPLTRKESQC